MPQPKDTKYKPAPHHRPTGAAWRSADILRAASIVAGLVIILTLFGVAVASGVDKLARYKVPRGIGAAIVVILFLLILYTLGSIVAPTIAQQGHELRQRLPDAVERVEGWLNKRNPALMSSLLGADSTQAPVAAESTQTKGAGPEKARAPGGAKAAAQVTTT